jgi:hypothetical protein
MPSLTIHYETEAERAIIEQALAFVAEMRQLALAAPAGQVLDSCEGFALDAGRKLLQDTLQNTAQARIDAEEKKLAALDAAPAPAATTSRDDTPAN